MAFRRQAAGLMMLAIFAGGFFGGVAQAHAAVSLGTEYSEIQENGIIFANICSSPDEACACRDSGDCSIANVMQVFVNVSYLVLALSGSAALIAFVYGGVEFLTSAGNPDRVKRGKEALTGALIGIFIVFGAYGFVNLIIGILKNGTAPSGNIENTIGDDADKTIKTSQ